MYMYVVYAVLAYSYNKNVMFVSFPLSTGAFCIPFGNTSTLYVLVHVSGQYIFCDSTTCVHDVQCV